MTRTSAVGRKPKAQLGVTEAREQLAAAKRVFTCTLGFPRRCVRCGAPLDPLASDWHWTADGWRHYHRPGQKGGDHV